MMIIMLTPRNDQLALVLGLDSDKNKTVTYYRGNWQEYVNFPLKG